MLWKARTVSIGKARIYIDKRTFIETPVRSSKSSLGGEVVAEEANTKVREGSSAPNIVDNDLDIATTAANSESEQGDQLHKRPVGLRYKVAR